MAEIRPLEVKFRGDGGKEYKGPERRTGRTGRFAESRVADEISEFVTQGVVAVYGPGRKRNRPTIRFRKVGENPPPGVDDDNFREDITDTALGEVGGLLVDNAIQIEGVVSKDKKGGRRKR